MTVDLSALPPPDVVEALDYEEILAQLLADFRRRFPEFSAWVESDPALKLLEVVAYREHLLRARVNAAGTSAMLAHAAGADLTNLAALFAVERLPGESDDALRRRVVLSLGAHSTAGSAAGYEFHALSVAGIGYACARVDAPGTVRLTVSGETPVGVLDAATPAPMPSAATMRAVAAAVGDDVRPITDTVVVRRSNPVAYQIAASVRVDAAADAEATRRAAEASVRRAAAEVARCGPATTNDVWRSALVVALSVPGVVSVTL